MRSRCSGNMGLSGSGRSDRPWSCSAPAAYPPPSAPASTPAASPFNNPARSNGAPSTDDRPRGWVHPIHERSRVRQDPLVVLGGSHSAARQHGQQARRSRGDQIRCWWERLLRLGQGDQGSGRDGAVSRARKRTCVRSSRWLPRPLLMAAAGVRSPTACRLGRACPTSAQKSPPEIRPRTRKPRTLGPGLRT
jgi:hypothetical protein